MTQIKDEGAYNCIRDAFFICLFMHSLEAILKFRYLNFSFLLPFPWLKESTSHIHVPSGPYLSPLIEMLAKSLKQW